MSKHLRTSQADYADASASEREWLDRSPLGTAKSVKNRFGWKVKTVDETWQYVQRYCTQQGVRCPTRNAYAMALAYIHCYPARKDVREFLAIAVYHPSVSDRFFNEEVLRAVVIISQSLKTFEADMINWDDRLHGEFGHWNHCAHFDEQFTHIWDGFPLPVQKPTTWDGDAELVYSGDGSAVK